MNRLVLILIGLSFCLFLDSSMADAGTKGAIRNGDVNGSGNLDLADAVYILTYLFTDGAEPVEWTCPDDLITCQAGLVECQAEKETLQSQLSATYKGAGTRQ